MRATTRWKASARCCSCASSSSVRSSSPCCASSSAFWCSSSSRLCCADSAISLKAAISVCASATPPSAHARVPVALAAQRRGRRDALDRRDDQPRQVAAVDHDQQRAEDQPQQREQDRARGGRVAFVAHVGGVLALGPFEGGELGADRVDLALADAGGDRPARLLGVGARPRDLRRDVAADVLLRAPDRLLGQSAAAVGAGRRDRPQQRLGRPGQLALGVLVGGEEVLVGGDDVAALGGLGVDDEPLDAVGGGDRAERAGEVAVGVVQLVDRAQRDRERGGDDHDEQRGADRETAVESAPEAAHQSGLR